MKKYFPIMIATFIWVWPPIFIKLLTFHFDNLTQNFYRYFAASIVLVIINLICYKKTFLKEFRNIKKFILPTLLIFAFQISWVTALTILSPTIAVLINRSNVLFVTAFSFFMFSEERKIIKSKTFISGSLLAIVGVVGVVSGKHYMHIQDFNLGVVMVLITAFLWSIYIVTIKKRVRKTEPLVVAGIVFTLSVPLFFISSLFFGDLSKILDTPANINFLLFVSGIFCVGVANTFNFKSIKLIGASISSTFVLITPFLTGIVSYFIFKEILNIKQITFGIILIIGCAILLRARNNSQTKAEVLSHD